MSILYDFQRIVDYYRRTEVFALSILGIWLLGIISVDLSQNMQLLSLRILHKVYNIQRNSLSSSRVPLALKKRSFAFMI